MIEKPTIAVDFDGVIHSYKTPFEREDIIPDPPIEPAKFSIAQLRKFFKVIIFSARARKPEGKLAIEKWLNDYNIIVDGVTAFKIPAKIYIDDRGLRFENWAQTLGDVFVLMKELGK